MLLNLSESFKFIRVADLTVWQTRSMRFVYTKLIYVVNSSCIKIEVSRRLLYGRESEEYEHWLVSVIEST